MSSREIRLVEQLAPGLESVALDTLDEAKRLALPWKDSIQIEIWDTWRPHRKQWEHYRHGRKQTGLGQWVRIPHQKVRTNAMPWQTPHCTVTTDGRPAALAWHLVAVYVDEQGRRAWASAKHEAWAAIGTAVHNVGGNRLEWGGLWRSIKDYAHVELECWRSLVDPQNRLIKEVSW